MRYHSDSPRLVRPVPRPSAQIHEAVCDGVAPRAWVAAKINAIELVKPTRTATRPATVAETERSVRRERDKVGWRGGGRS
ncbi:hypothetical protein GCM10007918_35850 [Piscinibacter gummiphilus]|nr:hypothetical protein GCM10007918_35850 [Piscinibacter gummiphilus]